MNVERLRFAVKWAIGHFFASAFVVSLAAALVFWVWYPAPWRHMLGVATIFGIVVVADLVCGPLLTLVLASPRKSRRERWLDLTLVGIIQLSALGYGLWSVHLARPVVLAFEVDRFFVVTANEVQLELLERAPRGLRKLPWSGLLWVSLREPTSASEYLDSVAMSVEGVSQAMRPNWWQALDENAKAAIRQKAKPLVELASRRSDQSEEIAKAVLRTGLDIDALLYLPLTSSKSSDWIALVDSSGGMVGYAEVDGFD